VTAAGFPGLPLAAAEADSPSVERRPRNFLAPRERRRLFWAFMPPALIVVVALELFTRSSGPPGPPPVPQIDTRLEAVAGPPPATDEVVIVPADEPPVARLEELSASPASLGRVRDATFFRQADEDAWLESLLTLQGYEGRSLPPPQEVGFTEIFGQPKSFRGRSVRMRGTLHRLEQLRAPENNYAIDQYWQGWLEPAGGPASPIVVHLLELPEGMATGMEIHEPVVIDGCFFKNMAYRAGDGVRVAPLLLARSPTRPAATGAGSGGGWWDLSLAAIGVVTMLAIVATIAIGFLVAGRGRRATPRAGDLDAALAGVEPVSIGESLRRVAADELADGREPDGDDA
jgi:hypothetical protein